MTGTVVQNSLYDLASLIRFLRVPVLDDPTNFRRHIAGRRKSVGGIPKPDYANLKLLLGSICLRRCTSTVLYGLGVTFLVRRPRLSESDRRAYDNFALACDRSIKQAVNGRLTEQENKSILTAVLRLRIFCNIGPSALIGDPSQEVGDGDEYGSDEDISPSENGDVICEQCSEMSALGAGEVDSRRRESSPRRMKCRFCASRVAGVDDAGSPLEDCARFPPPISMGAVQDTEMDDRCHASSADTSNQGCYSSKLNALLADIQEHYSQDKR